MNEVLRLAPEHVSAIDQRALEHVAAKRRRESDAAGQALSQDRDTAAAETPTPPDAPKGPAPQVSLDEPILEEQLPESLRKRFVYTAGKFYSITNPSEPAFEDQGPSVATKTDDPAVAQAMIDLADAKGWRAIKLTGTEEFRREAWLAASLRGIEVAGFKPREADLARLKVASAVQDTQPRRDEQTTTATHGQVEIDGKHATAIHFERRQEGTSTVYDVRFTRGQANVATLQSLDELALVDAVGDANAKALRESERPTGKLIGEGLAANYGLSPAEANRRSVAKEVRKEQEWRAAAMNGDKPLRSEQEPALSAPQRTAVQALAAIMRERGDSDKAIAMATAMVAERFHAARTYVGELVEHGAAPYENNPTNEPSYYVKLRTPQGDKVLWGVDLQRAVTEGRLRDGDQVVITYEGRKEVQVPVTERDEAGRVIGQSTISTHRNEWAAHDLAGLGQAVRSQVEAAARAGAREPVIKVHAADARRPGAEVPAPQHSVQRGQTRARA